MEKSRINVLLDIGANEGGYAELMRRIGYQGKIVSFEPLGTVFSILTAKSKSDPHWQAKPWALGDKDGTDLINVSANTASSSLLGILEKHSSNAPQAKFVAQESIEVRKLDSVFDQFCQEDDRVMVKIDTQGYEKRVLAGAAQVISRISILQLEMSVVGLYQGETAFRDMLDYLYESDFTLVSIENGFASPHTGELLQFDGIFAHNSVVEEFANSSPVFVESIAN